MATQDKRFKRRQYIVDKPIQYRYIFLMLIYLFIFFLMTVVIIYITGWSQLVEKMANVYPQARLVTILNKIYMHLFIGFLLLIPFAVTTAILASHKIAGPLVRIKRALRSIAEGDYSVILRLRENDQLKDVANEINRLVEALKKKK